MNVESAYQLWAPSYDSVVNPTRDLDAAILRETLAGRRFHRLLEIGCGTGKNTEWLASFADELVAMDFSSAMMEQARRKAPQAHVRFVQADIQQPWPIDGEGFDLIVCNLVLEHVQELTPVFSHARRCLAAGGAFYVSELHPYKQYLGSQARFQLDGAEQRIPAFTHHLSEFSSAGEAAGLRLMKVGEYWDDPARVQPPRLLTLTFEAA